MPELPEIECVKRTLESRIKGKNIKKVCVVCDKFRVKLPKNFASALEGEKVVALYRRGKYLLIEASKGKVLIVHLGMSGRLVFSDPAKESQKHDHVIFQFSTAKKQKGQMVFNDVRRFGFMDITSKNKLWQHKRLASLGCEPLSDDWQPATIFKKSKASLKAALLNQKLVAGIGNIYACEALYKAKLNPKAKAGSLSKTQYQALCRAVVNIIERAIKAGGATLEDKGYVDGRGNSGRFQHRFKVYARHGQPCCNKNCSSEIKKIVQNGRSTFYCPHCQK